MSFADIHGQDRAIGRLRGFLQTDVVPQALLFVGPEGTGKAKAALTFARALNCGRTDRQNERMQDLTPFQRRIEPCGSGEEACTSCRLIAASTHPDVLAVGPDESRLKVDQVREALEMIRLRRLSARRRVVIFLDAHTLMLQAANALLKTLEEPPEATSLILVAQGTRGIPLTVLSRCWPVRFSPLREGTLKSTVDFSGLSPEHAERVAAYGHGIPGKAARYVAWFKSGEAMKFLSAYWSGVREGGGSALSFSEKYGRDKEDFASRLDLLADALNAGLVRSLSPAEKSPYPPKVWLGLVESVLHAKRFLDVNANRRLMLEGLIYEARNVAGVKPAPTTSSPGPR
ncbi:MAG: hypothetical protein HYT87_11690 [Nitrospirae bacterium]|nr:hypothetical protein [Nitrospirota bacterium]